MKKLMDEYQQYSWPISKAAETGLYMITSPEVEGLSGKFYGNKQEKEIAPEWISESGQKTIWDYCTKVLEPYLS